ncbi:MAG: AI-2E family transporter [Bacteroidia bacterium]|nr:AI-2E family transporter [Bacteroidia bacterium]
MNVLKLSKWILVVVIAILLIVYLGNLLMMILSAYILFSMLHPLKLYAQHKMKVKSNTISSLLVVIFPFVLLSLIVMYIFPVIITQLNSLTYLSYQDVFENIMNQFPYINELINHLGGRKYVLMSIQDVMNSIININIIAKWSSILLNNFSQVVLNLLITFFITFHLLKDEKFMSRIIDKIISESYDKDIEQISSHIRTILGKYFRGLLIDVLIVMTVNSAILSILGIKNAFLIGILSGILNIIPYIGPLITLFIGLFLGVSSNIIEGHYELISGTVLKTIFTLVTVNILDGTILQPYIFSSILKAHPLEIFLIIVGAGMIGGITWMMLIIPIYVIIKIIIQEVYQYLESKKHA